MDLRQPASGAGTISLGDLPVSRPGLGAIHITGNEIWGDPSDKEQAIATLRRSVDLGVTFKISLPGLTPAASDSHQYRHGQLRPAARPHGSWRVMAAFRDHVTRLPPRGPGREMPGAASAARGGRRRGCRARRGPGL
jgi:hypothetical protein